MLFYISFYVGTVDSTEVQVRPAYESWMENFTSIVIIEYVSYRRINIIKTKSLAFLMRAIIFAGMERYR